MTDLIVADVVVRQDAEGRYCLNDLQRAATVGRNPRTVELHEFMRRPETQELVAELENTGNSRIKPVETKRGRNGGTFVVKELVYAYAMWISPAFNLKVIRAFDTLQTQGVAVADHAAEDVLEHPLDYLEKLVQQAKKLKDERDRLKTERDGVVKTIGVFEHTINRVVRMFPGVNTNRTKADLCDLGYLHRRYGHYRVYAKYRHLFVEKFDEKTGRGNIYCTPEGKALLARLYEEGKLTMKVGYQAA